MTRVRVLLLVALLAGCASESPSPSVSGSPSPEPSTSHPEPSGSTAPLDVASVPIWRLGWTDGAAMQEDGLRVGMADGAVSAHIATLGMWLERSKLEIVRGPAAGQVLYGRELVGGIDLHLVDAASGVDRVVVRVPRRTQDAELAPDGSALYWIDGSAANGGTWRLDLATGERSLLLPRVQVAAVPDGAVVAAVAEPRAQLAVSADGTRLAALWCGVERCLLQVLRFGDDAIEGMQLVEIWHELLGFAGDQVALGGACADVAAQVLRNGDCEHPDATAYAAYLSLNLHMGAELPAGWALEIVPVPDAEPMSFQLQAVAVPDGGGAPVTLEALGVLAGQ